METAVAERFLIDLAAALHRNGMPAYRIEDSLARVGQRFGITLNAFTVPTGLTLAFGPIDAQRVHVLRVQPGAIDLARTDALSALIEEIADGTLDAAAASDRLLDVETSPLPHGPVATAIAYALAAGSAAVLLDGDAKDALCSAFVGLLVGALSIAAQHSERVARLFELGTAAMAATLATLLAATPLESSPRIVSLASIIVVLPGYTFTVALNELASRHLSSGTSRLGGAFTSFLLLACGAGIGFALGGAIVPSVGLAEPHEPGSIWTMLATLPVAALSFKVLFQARHADTGWIVLAAVVAFAGAHVGALALGPAIGAATGAMLLGAVSNLLARARHRPSAITLVPGLMVLVPGSLGLSALTSLFRVEALGTEAMSPQLAAGVSLVIRMLSVGTSLVCGLLVANVVLPSRRSL